MLSDVADQYHEMFGPHFRGFECGDGWAALIDSTLDELRSRCPNARISQLKEKLGGLRIYLEDKSDEEAKGILRRAEDQSFSICEQCGERGELRRTPGCLRARCAAHAGS